MQYCIQTRFKVKGLFEKWMPFYCDGHPVVLNEGQEIPQHYRPMDDSQEVRCLPVDLINEVN